MIGSSGTDVLIIDDNEVCCMLLKEQLEQSGLTATYVLHGEQAIAAIQTAQPELLILDIFLPTIDGFEINREIQKQSTPPYIIAISQYSSALECMSYLGANETFSKNNFDLIVQAVKIYFNK